MPARTMLRPIAILGLLTATAAAEPPGATTPEAPAAPQKLLGVGYKAGNGVGFLGADLIVNPIPHLGFDLQGSLFPVTIQSPNGMTSSATGYAIAPAVRGYLYDGQRSTPYLSVGAVYARLTLDTVTAAATGTFANLGYEWRWSFGLGIHVGGGVGYLTKAEATDGVRTVSFGGKVNPNLEFGLSYMFL
jgi:hypothetical protein